jgi:hypothetical protein
LLQVRSEYVVPHIPDMKPGGARHTVDGSLVRVEWPIHGRTLQLEANLSDSPVSRHANRATTLLFSTAADTLSPDLHAWEVRLCET